MKQSILVCALMAVSFSLFAQNRQPLKKPTPSAKTATAKFGALAIDRSNGYYYGYAFEYPTRAAAEKKAVDECTQKGGNCSVVLTYSGTGCAAYRTVDGSVGTAFGWGVAKTKEEADAIATAECLKRSGGNPASNFVWSCNSANTGNLKEIYNASDEIEAPVTVGSQTWSNRNLDVSTFRNGDPIPEAKNADEWQEFCKTNKPAFCYRNFDPTNGPKTGKLYNFHAVMDPRGLAPQGWHIPNKAEFETLINFLGGKYEAGKRLRATTGWDKPDKNGFAYGNGSNSSGLNFMNSGQAWENEYDGQNPPVSSVFKGNNSQGQWWSSTIDGDARWNDNGGQYGYYNNGFTLYFGTNNYTGVGSEAPQRGFSVRVIKD